MLHIALAVIPVFIVSFFAIYITRDATNHPEEYDWRGLILVVASWVITIGLAFGTFWFTEYFYRNAETIVSEEIQDTEAYEILDYRQCANGVFVTFCNRFNQEEGLFLENYIIEEAEDPFLEIRDVKTQTKKVWKKFYEKKSTEKIQYVVHVEVPH